MLSKFSKLIRSTFCVIKMTLEGCQDSAPGPDGIPYSYLRGLWNQLGPILFEAWNYTLLTGNLCPSHKLSFLKLIPKHGKDASKLTNWRPITLSNCDHKIITKTYASRLGTRMAESLKERQTAYIKGRIINDNIRAILGTVNLANLEEAVDGVIVSLDAKKAFDSVDHSYIEKCLVKFGLVNFVRIFKILYKDLKSDIIINGQIVNGFKIKRGVKQGDALSCILFIMCMEPLLTNIENNPNIEPIRSEKIGVTLPKVYAYADDVNCTVKHDTAVVQEVFAEYERLTKISGLELNAEKTELLAFKSRQAQPIEKEHIVSYLGRRYEIKTKPKIKVNGIFFLQNLNETRRANVDAVAAKMDEQLRRWSSRRLSLLGKILIIKTFGISQLIFLLQSMSLTVADFKLLNALLYKFLWNRNYQAAKAPERVRREIINKEIRLGGFGMLDISELDKSLKLRMLGRLFDSNHPFLEILRRRLKLGSFFYPEIDTKIDPVLTHAVSILGIDRRQMWETPSDKLELKAVRLIKRTKLQDCVNSIGKNSLAYFNLRRRGLTDLGQLNLRELLSLKRFVNENLLNRCRETCTFDLRQVGAFEHNRLIFSNIQLKDLTSLSSKKIREGRSSKEPICLFKSGLILDPAGTINWANKLRKVSSVKLRSTLLRIAHKELYTKEKLFRYRLIDSPNCPRCDAIEDFEHRLVGCQYAARIWVETFKISDKLNNGGRPHQIDPIGKILCEDIGTTVGTMTLHAEILTRILALRDDARYLIRPKIFVELAVKFLIKREKGRLKDLLKEIAMGF